MIFNYTSQTVCRENPYMQGLCDKMINDVDRNKFYDQMIQSLVADKVCCDIGFGSGILTMMAVKHGAKKVHAFEQDPATFDFGKAVIEKMGYADKVEFHNKRWNRKDPAYSYDIILHEILMRSVWGEGLYDVYKQNWKRVGDIHPSQVAVEIMACDDADYTQFGEAKPIDYNTGIDYLSSYEKCWHELMSSEEYFSFWPYNSQVNRKHILESFVSKIGEYSFDLNKDTIPEVIEVKVKVPSNCLVTIRGSANGFYMVREDNNDHWRPDKITHVATGGNLIFKHRTSDGHWWLEGDKDAVNDGC